MVKNSPANEEDSGFDPWGQEDVLEKEMAIHCKILTWEVPWTEEDARLQSIGLEKSQI